MACLAVLIEISTEKSKMFCYNKGKGFFKNTVFGILLNETADLSAQLRWDSSAS